MDFDFLKLRLDYALRARNPAPEPNKVESQYKWFYNFSPFTGIIQIGINYPFAF
jgi:hypothetical protein